MLNISLNSEVSSLFYSLPFSFFINTKILTIFVFCLPKKFMMKNLLRNLLFLMLLTLGLKSKAQTFECYIANDHLVSATVYEFDEYLISTSSLFNLRTIQNCFIFNPAFVSPGATVTVTIVAGSSQLISYNVGTLAWSSTAPGFQTTVNTGVSCATGTIINSNIPTRVATFRVESSLPFNCSPANPQMVIPGDPAPSGLALRMAVTKWNTIDCSSTMTTTITNNGTYSQNNPLTLYDSVQNMAPVIISQPNNASACNAGLVTFSVNAVSNSGIASPVTYQWYENGVMVSNGATGNGTYSGATTATLTISNPSVSLTGHQFYCIVSQCNSDTTNSVIITSSANDNNSCTVDACDPVTGIVTNTPVNIDDANPCTADACDPANGNISHTTINTDDGDGCTTDGCDPVTGVFHSPVNTNDNNPCTTDACDPANGNITHNPVVTDDGNGCTVDGCDTLSGIYHTPLNINDNNMCTFDACDAATGIVSHNPINTDDSNACTTDGCDSLSGVYHIAQNTDDGDACTFDYCNTNTGVITHTVLPVDDNNACTTDGCDAITGMFHTPVNIDDGNSCTLDACDTVSGSISHTNINSSSPALSVNDQCGYSVLTASGFTGSLLWSTNETTPSINVTSAGLYSVTQNISGCVSPPAIISASPLTLPSVSLGSDTLVNAGNYTLDPGPGYLSYLWSTGATTQTITVQSSGWFWVTVTNSNCPATDSVFVDFFLGISSAESQNTFTVFPNPSRGAFAITFNKEMKNVNFEIFNSTGVLVYSTEKKHISMNEPVALHMNVAFGVYLLRINSADGYLIKHLIIE